MDTTGDAGVAAVLGHLGVQPEAKLGHGGEAVVYAIDDERVVRVLHEGGRVDDIVRRQRLVDELARAQPPYALPRVIETGDVDGRVYAIERRLRGRSLLDELKSASGAQRRRLIEAYLETAAALGDLRLDPRTEFGDLVGDDPVTAPTWRAFLEAKAAANLARSTPALRGIDPVALAAPFDEPATKSFVHLDAFAGNMLTDGTSITAVIDIGVTSVAGDRRFDVLASATYLGAPVEPSAASESDSRFALGWLRDRGLDGGYDEFRRWIAAYWSFALDDARLLAWCESVLT